jgi:hypothetical protein
MLPVFIGWDSREAVAADVCRFSLLRRASVPLHVRFLKQAPLREIGLYRRECDKRGGQMVDRIDGKPFSTEFSFTRFLVPALCQYDGWALFVDGDFLFLDDVAELFDRRDERFAVMVCKQAHDPVHATKMDGCVQQAYPRKNWSSLMLLNCSHEATRRLTPGAVNGEPGAWLHGLRWLPDRLIGELPPAWNWIEGVTRGEPKAVHFTAGGPWFAGCEAVRFAGEWQWHRAEADRQGRQLGQRFGMAA